MNNFTYFKRSSKGDFYEKNKKHRCNITLHFYKTKIQIRTGKYTKKRAKKALFYGGHEETRTPTR